LIGTAGKPKFFFSLLGDEEEAKGLLYRLFHAIQKHESSPAPIKMATNKVAGSEKLEERERDCCTY